MFKKTYDDGIERCLLGCLMLKYEDYGLTPDDFALNDHKELFKALPADSNTLISKFAQHTDIIKECVQSVVLLSAAPDYAEQLKEFTRERRLQDVAAAIKNGATKQEAEVLLESIESSGELKPVSFKKRNIPKREWIYGRHLLKNFSSMTVGASGTGKSTLAIIDALSICTGKNLAGNHVVKPEKVFVYNLEDPIEEIERRVLAACAYHQIDPEELEGKLFLQSGRDKPLIIAQKTANGSYLYPDRSALIKAIQSQKIGVLIVDPFIRSYDGDENSNKDVDAAVAAFNYVASKTGCAIELIHHTGKGTQEGQNAGRGASSMVGAVRAFRTLVGMTEQEGIDLGVDELEYVRFDTPKPNMAKKTKEKQWLRIVVADPGNGEEVATMELWNKPGLFDKYSKSELVELLNHIQTGREKNNRYHRTAKGNAAAWVGNAFISFLNVSEETAFDMINVWYKNGLLYDEKYITDKNNYRQGVFVNQEKLSSF